MNLNLKNKYFILFFILQILLVTLLYSFYNYIIDKRTSEFINTSQAKYDATINTFQVLTDTFYDNQSKFLSSVMSEVIDSNESKKDELREKVLNHLNYFYINEKLRNMEVFHIFEANGKSFLRFHKQDKYGDDIYLKRYSLRNIKDKKISQNGLEIGIWKESFRFQFPLFYNGEFVGMFEYGMGFQEIANEMKKVFKEEYLYILKKSEVKTIMPEYVINKRFENSLLHPEYFSLKQHHLSKDLQQVVKSLSKSDELKIQINQKNKKPFILFFKSANNAYSATFLPINNILGEHTAYHIVLNEGDINPLFTMLFAIYILSSFTIIAILFNIYKIANDREFINTILNSQTDMVILTNGIEIQSANSTVLEFLSYPSLEALKEEHSCICDFFIPDNGFLLKEKDDTSWLEYMKQHPQKYHKAKMHNLTQVRDEIFHVKFKQFQNGNNYIITFSNITNSEIVKDELHHRANHDRLTKLYNRHYFDTYLEKILSNAQRYGNNFSLIMFDIDHFKNVNDTYGHDVGDQILIDIANIVQSRIRRGDVLARWGGEEFMLIIMDTMPSSNILANKLRADIENYNFETVGNLTCSFGVTQYKNNDTFSTLLKRVDENLYLAKHRGRNKVISR